jgi:beta-lactam-binding protein with PASTA domain
VGFGRLALSAAGKVGIVLAVIAAFIFGMLATVYLSLRTAEVKVPDVLGKDRLTAENMLDEAGLKIRVRGARASAERPDTVLSQLPEAGQIVKVGIPVAVEISRAPKEGESVPVKEEPKQEQEKPAENANANANQSTATNQNQNQNRSQKNKNKNANNANSKNANNGNNANANRAPNANGNRNSNANAPRNGNSGGNSNATTAPNANRTPNNQNANRRAPAATPPPARPAATGTP